MKKKILSLGAVIAICLGVCTFSVSQSNVELSTLALDNVEALASWEDSADMTKDMDCLSCLTTEGQFGMYTYCEPGNAGCVVSSCVSGSCSRS